MKSNEEIYADVVDIIENYFENIIDHHFDGDAEVFDAETEVNILRCFLEVGAAKLYNVTNPSEFNDIVDSVCEDVAEEYVLN